jgi:uncharacterized membrane protein
MRTECRGVRAIVVVAALLAFAFLAGTVALPLLEATDVSGARLGRLAYAPLCHQKPERSLAIAGSTQAVCARCAGLYLGGVCGLAAAGLGWLARRALPGAVWLGLLAIPNAVDAAAATAGLPSLSNLPRLVVAMPLGVVAGLFLGAAIEEIATERLGRPARAE